MGALTPAEIAEMLAADAHQRALRDDEDLRLRGIVGERKFDPGQPRDPHSGEWSKIGGAIKDALKLAGRIDLGDGEHLAHSDLIEAQDSVIPMAWVDGPDGMKLRIGLGILDEDRGHWKAADKGGTVVLDEAGARKLADATRKMRAAGARGLDHKRELDSRIDGLQTRQRDLVHRQYPTLSKQQAAELDKLDERIQDTTSRITHAESRQTEAIAELPPAARARHDQINAEIEDLTAKRRAITAAFWAGGGKDMASLDRAKQIDFQVEDLLDEQANLHHQRETPKSRVGYVTLFKKRRDELESLQHELDGALARRAELTVNSVPLSTADAEALKSATADLERAYGEYMDLVDGGDPLTSGVVSGQWGDIVYETTMTDIGPDYRIGVRPPGAGEDWSLSDTEAQSSLSDADLAALERRLTAGPGGDTRSADDGELRLAGNSNQLHQYWTKGEGLAKWAKSPHPWTSLYHHLLKFLGPERAKRVAAEWFHDVFGFWPGSDLNRVTHGKPPRGKKIGPG